jgi:hypothetical protein
MSRESYEDKVAREEASHRDYLEQKKRERDWSSRPLFWTQSHTDRELSGETVEPPYVPEKR